MSEKSRNETELRQYLLGELSLDRQVLIEQRLFLDGDYAEFAEAVENDLIDDYLHNDLTSGEKERFDRYFLESPEHRVDLKIGAALKRYLTTRRSNGRKDLRTKLLVWGRRPTLWLAFAAAGLVIFGVISWLAFNSMRSRPGSIPLQAQQQPSVPPHDHPPSTPLPTDQKNVTAQQRDHTPNEVATNDGKNPQRNRPPDWRSHFASFTLSPTGLSTRGEAQSTLITLHSTVKRVTLKLPVVTTHGYDSYSATLSSGNRTIHNWSDLVAENDDELGKIVRLNIAAAVLNEQSYEIKLAGLDAESRPSEIVTYAFRVERK